MPQDTLAQKVRAKYPGAYDDLSDQDLEAKVKAKYPGVYDDIPTTPDSSGAEQQSGTLPVGSPVTRLVSGAANALNPIPIVQALSSPQATGEAIQGIVNQSVTRGGEAYDAFRQGNYSQAVDRGIGAIPIVGPAIESMAGKIDEGNIAGAIGEGAALAIPTPGPRGGFRPGPFELPPSGMGARAADVAQRLSTRRMTQAITPHGGPNQLRFGGQAAEVAPRLAREEGMSALTRSGMADKVSKQFEGQQQALDTAANERFAGAAFDNTSTLAGLRKARQELVAEAIEGSRVEPDRYFSADRTKKGDVRGGVPIGEDQIPAPYRARVAVLDQIIKEVEGLGPMARYESLRKIREAWDQVAKVRYNPSTSADYLLKNAEASGAAQGTHVLREELAKMDPNTAAVNKQYSFWKKVDDVVQAAEEWDQSRPPSTTRSRIAAGTGAVAGAMTGQGMTGIIVGSIVGAGAEHAISTGLTTRIMASRQLAKLEDALRAQNAGSIRSELIRYAQMTGQTADFNALLAGSESRQPKRGEATPSVE